MMLRATVGAGVNGVLRCLKEGGLLLFCIQEPQYALVCLC